MSFLSRSNSSVISDVYLLYYSFILQLCTQPYLSEKSNHHSCKCSTSTSTSTSTPTTYKQHNRLVLAQIIPLLNYSPPQLESQKHNTHAPVSSF